MNRLAMLPLLALGALGTPNTAPAGPPCDTYPETKQPRCEKLWQAINAEAESEMAQFGWSQQKRRQEGQITQEQHLRENMAFIRRSAEKRLKLLADRMGKE